MTWSEVVDRPVREASLFDATRTACWALAAKLLAAFFSAAYLPMVDLPQHAAQVETWRRLADAGSPEARVFALNLGTPYLGAYAAARLLAAGIGVVKAWKLVIWAAAALYTVAFADLLR